MSITVEVYRAQRLPCAEWGVVAHQGGRELVREEEFWSRDRAERAVERIRAQAEREAF